MRLIRSPDTLEQRSAPGPCVAAIGAFDGLHLGHQVILRQARDLARARNERSVVVSFEPTPAEFFSSAEPPARLTCFRERVELLCELGIDELFCPRFATIRHWHPERFVDELLATRLRASHVVIGHDFRFGAGRAGTLGWLKERGEQLGIEIVDIDPVRLAGARISSTAIRAALADARLDDAAAMLGRTYTIAGRVVYGRGLGRDLGFPTANVNLKRKLSPVQGIFAVRVHGLQDEPLDGVASVGTRPTIGGGDALLEVFIFDFDRDIYGQYITVEFVEYLREEKTFPDLETLRRQMQADAAAAQAALTRRIA